MEGTCLLIDIVKSFIHSEVFENVEERGLSVRGWWANPFWEKNVLKNEEICAGREKEHTGTKMVLHLTGECPAKYPFAECKYPDENSKKQV